jgi:pimeloyl-ACP methyl ester carboxylesterase
LEASIRQYLNIYLNNIEIMQEKLYYEEEGKENKEAIIFIHNNLLNNWIWENQRNVFNSYHCIYLDLPDHGKSQLKTDFSIVKSVEYIENIIENDLKNKKVHLIGISIGGTMIIDLLYKYPNLIKTAIISGVNIKSKLKDDDNLNEIAIKLEDKRINELLNSLKECKTTILDKKHPNFIIQAFLAEYGIGRKYFNQLKLSIDINNFVKITDEYLKYRIPNEINNFPNLLILYGTKEYPKVQKSAKTIQYHFPNAKIFKVNRAIHLWNIINPEYFNEIIQEFIKNKNIKIFF